MVEEADNGKASADSPAPTVFISYSHDSAEHKTWVAGLATDLRRHSVDAILDQWRLRPGMDVPSFMERGIRDSNRVVIVCTPQYARKADAGKGGVGYEKMIVTGELYRDLGSEKFVPVLVEGDEGEARPSFLKGRYYVDFRNPAQYEEKREELVRALLQIPRNVEPPLGRNPFLPVPEEKNLFAPSLSVQPVDLPLATGPSPEEVYETCQELFRRGDTVGWYELVKSVRTPVESNLLGWRKNYTERLSGGESKDLYSTIDEGVGIVAPLMALALASVESRQPQFNDQRAMLDELIQISGWSYHASDLMMVCGMLEALAYVYHCLHGATCMMTNQLQVALRFATMRVHYVNRVDMLWKQRDLLCFPDGFEGKAMKAWGYIVKAPERLPWLSRIFSRTSDYDRALTAYWMVLTAIECSELLSRPADSKRVFEAHATAAEASQLPGNRLIPDALPMFIHMPRNVRERAFMAAFPDATAVQLIADTSSIDPQILRDHWKDWNLAIARSIRDPSGFPIDFDDVWVGELP